MILFHQSVEVFVLADLNRRTGLRLESYWLLLHA